MRSSEVRAAKYAARMSGEALSPIMQRRLNSAISGQASAADDAVAVDTLTRSVLNVQSSGVTFVGLPFYLNFGRQVYAKSQRSGGQALAVECAAISALWQSRGLESGVLTAIMDAFGIPAVVAP